MNNATINPSLVQGDLFAVAPQRSPDELKQALGLRSGRALCLAVTRNRSQMVSLTLHGKEEPVRVRLHEAFLQAPDHVIQSLGKYLKRPRRADWRVVSDFAQTITPTDTRRRAASTLSRRGKVYDLAELGERVNRRFFQGRLACRVEWAPERARPSRTRRRQSIRYGSYRRDTDTIRIHPLLDDGRVPEAFIKYILYHEMLHAVVPPERINGRWLFHPPAFNHLDRRFPDWRRMQRLGKELLDLLG